MAKTKEQKKVVLDALQESLSDSKGIVFSTFTNVGIKDQENLRKKFREQGVTFQIIKKTLVKKALEAKGFAHSQVDEWFGNIGAAISKDDEVAPARVLVTETKDIDGFEVKNGILEGELIETEKVLALAHLPSKEELFAKVVGSIAAPISGFVNVLGGTQRNFVNVLNQIKEKKE